MQPQNPKPFAWSYSRLKNYETCPKKSWHNDVAKDVPQEESEALTWGNEVHKHIANRIFKKMPLPPTMSGYEKWAVRVLSGVTENVTLLVEQRYAITDKFSPCEYFDKAAWYRGVGDVVKIAGPVGYIGDWKTGKVVEDSQQLALMAACLFAHFPALQKVKSEFIWLKYDTTTPEYYARADMPGMWRNLWPRIEQLKNAHDTFDYPPKPSRICRSWCNVTKCPHHGEIV